MGATTPDALPYPEATASPFVHLDIKALAEAVQTLIAAQPDHAMARPSVAQTLATSGTSAKMVLGTTVSSSGVTVNLAAGTLTVSRAGLYVIAGGVGWVANATGYRSIVLNQGANSIAAATIPGFSPGGNFVSTSIVQRLAAGDAVSADIMQTSGGSLATFGFADRSFLSLARIGA